jgi:hypothetical protein
MVWGLGFRVQGSELRVGGGTVVAGVGVLGREEGLLEESPRDEDAIYLPRVAPIHLQRDW